MYFPVITEIDNKFLKNTEKEDNMGTGWANLMGNFNPAGTQSIADTYSYWLRNNMGANPLAYNYGAANQPWTSLAYLTDPLRRGVDINAGGYMTQANPFLSFLENTTPTVGQTAPQFGQDWRQRAIDVSSALGQAAGTPFDASVDPFGTGADLLRQRFSANESTDAGTAEARQRALAFAPVMSGTGQALRGEISNLLNNIYQNFQMQTPTGAGSFLDWAMRGANNQAGLWERFGLTPAGTVSGGVTGSTANTTGSANIG